MCGYIDLLQTEVKFFALVLVILRNRMKGPVLFLPFVVAMHCDGMEPGFVLLPTLPGFNKQFYMYIMTMWSRKPDFFIYLFVPVYYKKKSGAYFSCTHSIC